MHCLTCDRGDLDTLTSTFSSQTASAQPESPSSINISLCASKCIRWSLLARERIFQYLRSLFGVSHEHKRCLLPYFAAPPSLSPPQSQEAWDVIGRRACSKGGQFLRGREEGLRWRKSTNTGQSDGTDVLPICVSRLHVFCPRREKASFIFKQTSKSNYLHGGRVGVHFVFHVLTVISLWHEPSVTRGTYLVSGCFHCHSITHSNIIILKVTNAKKINLLYPSLIL